MRDRYKNELIKDAAMFIFGICMVAVLLFLMSGCSTKKRFIQTNDVNVTTSDHKDSTHVDTESKITDLNEIFKQDNNINTDTEITFEGEITTTDKDGNKTTLNGTLNISQKNEDKSKKSNTTSISENKKDSTHVSIIEKNDSVLTDNTITESNKKMSSTPTVAVFGIILGILLLILAIWHRIKNYGK